MLLRALPLLSIIFRLSKPISVHIYFSKNYPSLQVMSIDLFPLIDDNITDSNTDDMSIESTLVFIFSVLVFSLIIIIIVILLWYIFWKVFLSKFRFIREITSGMNETSTENENTKSTKTRKTRLD